MPAHLSKPLRHAWAQWIGPETLISQVRGTAPFLEPRLPATEPGRLMELGHGPDGFLRILANWENMLGPNLNPEEQLQDYFAFCLACHHATVATFVPTDVDTKIRGIVWRESRDPDVLRPMLRLALASRAWTEDGISIRAIRGVSGHNGEQWSAIAGGLGHLLELGHSPDGFLHILANWENMLRPNLNPEEQLQDYFAFCLACHHATVATFVPTDVDTKIRGIVWRESRDPDVLRPMLRLALASRAWTEDGISIRAIRGVSGHNGEQWSAIAGGLGHLLELGDTVSAGEAQAAIEAEIEREQAVFDEVAAEPGAELDLLRLSMTLAHNRGDLTQGMGFWKRTPLTAPVMEHLSERGRFPLAVRMYQFTGLSAEGHRHYPLRAVKVLRHSPATLLPLCPFLDEWGGVVAQLEDSHEVLAALVGGCQKVQGQQGYYRAIAGMRAASSGAFERAAARMPNGAQRLLRGAELRKLIDVPRVSFESMMRKRCRTALAMFSGTG